MKEEKKKEKKEELKGILAFIERIGNKVPDLTVLFVGAFLLVCILSAILSQIHFNYIHPGTGKVIAITNMLSADSIVKLMSSMVNNYAHFPPLTMVIVATIGIGIVDGSGYINTGLKKILSVTPKVLITPVVIIVGMLSHLAPDSGYVIIIPVAAYIFYASGKHPLAGVAVAFAGIAGAFAANYTPSAIDPIIQGFTQSASHIINPNYQVNILCNYYFAFASTFGVIAGCWWVSEHVVEPWLWKKYPLDENLKIENDTNTEITPKENRAFWIATGFLVLMVVVLVATLIPVDSMLRAPNGDITSFKAPIMKSIIALIFIFSSGVGLVYGFLSGKFKNTKDVTKAMEEITHTLVQLIVFYFFAAQFLYAFGASNIGALIAVSGAEFLKSLALPPQVTILGIIIFVGMLNLIITSASAKWAILAPIFVPMLMAVGISPELTQVAFRISDSSVNVVTPMFVFYPLIIIYCQKYVKEAGMGTLSSMMLPYTITLLIVLTAMLYIFWAFGIPLGLQASYVYPRPF